VAFGCSKEPEHHDAPTAAAPAAVQQAAKPAATAPAPAASAEAPVDCSKLDLKDSFDESAFSISVQGAPTYTAGQPGTVGITLKAKTGYHANNEYPYKLKLTPCTGLKYADEVVRGDAVKVTHDQAQMQVPLTPSEAGDRIFAGTFSFSVCSEEHCLVEKRDVGLRLKVQ
jgi:hypothetical protein